MALDVNFLKVVILPDGELLSKVGDGGFQAARSISFSPSLNLTPSTISARR